MRIKDLRWKGMFIWPPEWSVRIQRTCEEWILIDVRLHKDREPYYIDIEAACNGNSQGGVISLENPDHLETLYHILTDNIGKTLTEIGGIKIVF